MMLGLDRVHFFFEFKLIQCKAFDVSAEWLFSHPKLHYFFDAVAENDDVFSSQSE